MSEDLVFHSDLGSQYTSEDIVKKLLAYKIYTPLVIWVLRITMPVLNHFMGF